MYLLTLCRFSFCVVFSLGRTWLGSVNATDRIGSCKVYRCCVPRRSSRTQTTIPQNMLWQYSTILLQPRLVFSTLIFVYACYSLIVFLCLRYRAPDKRTRTHRAISLATSLLYILLYLVWCFRAMCLFSKLRTGWKRVYMCILNVYIRRFRAHFGKMTFWLVDGCVWHLADKLTQHKHHHHPVTRTQV